jgi:haloalkane dehalogenase
VQAFTDIVVAMRMLRTPDERFADLPDFSHEPRYAEIPDQDGGTLRMAYVEAGPADGPVVLCLHGEPSWSFLYRHVIRVLADAGLRAIAPDLVGFGRSDKPVEITDHSYARHIEWTRSLVFDALDLRDVTLVGQDWGGLIGLRLAVAHPERFARIVAANTGLPTGDFPMPETWLRFRESVRTAPEFDVARGIQSGCKTTLSEAVRAAYDAPFPEESYKAGPRAMPGLVPAEPGDPEAQPNRDAWDVLRSWEKPFLVAFSDQDPITGPMAPLFKQLVPGAASLPQNGMAHPTIEGAGHFLQEDDGERLGREIAAFVRETP